MKRTISKRLEDDKIVVNLRVSETINHKEPADNRLLRFLLLTLSTLLVGVGTFFGAVCGTLFAEADGIESQVVPIQVSLACVGAWVGSLVSATLRLYFEE